MWVEESRAELVCLQDPDNDGSTNYISLALLAAGSLTLSIACFGCCGLLRDNRLFLALYGVSIGILLVLEVLRSRVPVV